MEEDTVTMMQVTVVVAEVKVLVVAGERGLLAKAILEARRQRVPVNLLRAVEELVRQAVMVTVVEEELAEMVVLEKHIVLLVHLSITVAAEEEELDTKVLLEGLVVMEEVQLVQPQHQVVILMHPLFLDKTLVEVEVELVGLQGVLTSHLSMAVMVPTAS